MGNEQSQLAGSSSGAFGFQVLKNTNTQLDIDPWFDFICGINGRKIDDGNARLFQQEVANCAGSAVTLGIWSAKGQRLRDIVIPLKRGAVRGAGPQLGLTLQWCPLGVTEDVWHILDVAPGSPADLAGLLPYGDYILGSPEGMMRGEGALGELVEDVRLFPSLLPLPIDSSATSDSYLLTYLKYDSTSTDLFASTSTTTNTTSLAN